VRGASAQLGAAGDLSRAHGGAARDRRVEPLGSGQVERFPGIVERERALKNVSARDVLLDARIVSSCADLALRCEQVDGSLDLDASLDLLEEHFRPLLPQVPNV
jgi:hypothetical protein